MFHFLLEHLVFALTWGGEEDEEEVAEIKATYMYTFIGVIMPPYCHHLCVHPRWDLARRANEHGSG